MLFPWTSSWTKGVFFKISINGVGSGKSLVTQMQLIGDLQNVWIMFDHVKHVAIWTIMACHVYDLLRSDDHCSL
jgi:hypothetical protein